MVVTYRNEFYNDRFDKLSPFRYSSLDINICLFNRNRFFRIASGSLAYHIPCFGRERGLAQSLFQVGGNFGGSLGPLLVALLVAPYGRQHLLIFAFVALAAIAVMYPICKWYKAYLNRMKLRLSVSESRFISLCLWTKRLSLSGYY